MIKFLQGYYFKLQPLLNKEKIYEDECAERLRSIHEEYQEESHNYEKLVNCETRYQEELKAKKLKQVSPVELKVYEDYFIKVNGDINDSRITLSKIAERRRDAQNELSKKMKKRKALEKLKERGYEEFKRKLFSALDKELDEIAMAKFVRIKGLDNT